jgi:hypothetical protein
MLTPFTRLRRATVQRYNPETLALQSNILAAGGTISAASLLAADAFVTSAKISGVWPKLLDCGLFIGDQLAAALCKLVTYPGAAASFINQGFLAGDYTERGANGGLTGDGATKYVSTGLRASASIETLPGDSISVYLRSLAVASGAPAGADGLFLNVNVGRAPTPTHYQYAQDGALLSAAPVTVAPGLFTGSKLSAADYRLYFNGNQVAGPIPQAAPGVDGVVLVFAMSAGGVPENYWQGAISFYALGAGLTPLDNQNLYACVQALQQTLNRNV